MPVAPSFGRPKQDSTSLMSAGPHSKIPSEKDVGEGAGRKEGKRQQKIGEEHILQSMLVGDLAAFKEHTL